MSWRSPRLARRVWQICGTSGLFRTKRLASETPLLKHFDAGTLHLRYFYAARGRQISFQEIRNDGSTVQLFTSCVA